MPGRRPDSSVPVSLTRVGHECRARWILVYRGDRGGGQMSVSVGELDDGRWFLDPHGGGSDRCRAYPTKQAVWAAARVWMGERMAELGGRWESVPCYPQPRAG